MSAWAPEYRFVVYASRSVDPTEATVLTPAAGAAHGDNFKVSTLPNDAGYQPYLATEPDIDYGSLNIMTKHITTGQATVEVMDTRLGTANAVRWVAAFAGNAKGRHQLKGCKAYLSRSTDGGVTWTPAFVGRVKAVTFDPLVVAFTLYDLAEDLNVPVFGERPHSSVSYAVEPTLLPLGITGTYGPIGGVTPLTGAVGAAAYTPQTNVRIITLDGASQTRSDNILTAALLAEFGFMAQSATQATQFSTGVGLIDGAPSLRCRFSRASAPAITDKELEVVQLFTTPRGLTGSSPGHFAITAIGVRAVQETDDPFYKAFDSGTVANADVLTFTIRLTRYPSSLSPITHVFNPGDLQGRNRQNTYAISGSFAAQGGIPAVLVGDVALMTFVADVLSGNFSPLYKAYAGRRDFLPPGKSLGDAKYPIPYDVTAASWTNLASAPSGGVQIPRVRGVFSQVVQRFELLEKYVGQPFGVGFRFQPALMAGQPVSQCVPVDLRMPISGAGLPTVSDTDLVELPRLSDDIGSAISDLTIVYYHDLATDAATAAATGASIPAISPQLMTPIEATVVYPSLGEDASIAVGSKPMTIQALLIRGSPGEADDVTGTATGGSAKKRAEAVVGLYKSLFGSGAAEVPVRFRRTTTTEALWPGDYFYTTVSGLPSPSTNSRSDTCLLILTDRKERGPVIEGKAIVAGTGLACGVPSIGTPTQHTGNVNHGITDTITLNGDGDPVEWRIYVDQTAALTTPPNSNDPGWLHAGFVDATGAASVDNLRSGTRVFVEARSFSSPTSTATLAGLRLPSAWVRPSGTKYVALGTIGAPTSLSVLPSPILANSTIVASWANTASGSAALRVRLRVDGVTLPLLPAGSTTFTLNPYATTSSHTYTIVVDYLDELGGYSASVSTTFTTAGGMTGPTLGTATLALA